MTKPRLKPINIEIQHGLPPTSNTPCPTAHQLQAWVKAALPVETQAATITLRLVDIPEMTQFNTSYRGKIGPTNVLAFLDTETITTENTIEGDIAICAPIVAQEAQAQCKSTMAHWAHLTVHATLHLCGYDHLNSVDQNIMESLEIKILAGLGFDNPYVT